MCGIIGIVGTSEIASALYDGLTVLQHRGQDAAGIATAQGSRLRVHKGNGLVKDVFGKEHMHLLSGRMGIGHCRYPTAGSEGSDEAQPFYVNSPYGIALAHNGNLINTEQLRSEVFAQDRRQVNTESDSEVLLNVFAHALAKQGELNPAAAMQAVCEVHDRCVGGYAVVSLVLGLGLVAFRDPHGIRPLVLGRRETMEGIEYAVASESVALDILGFQRVRDIAPGECVVITARGELHAQPCVANARPHTPCIFEYVYFARPDSMIDDVSVHKARMRMGVKYREGFIKNRYIGRTFIMPGQGERVKSVRRKLNPIPLEFKDRVVLLVDDSIVRGTTSRQIIQMAREAGARKVYLASAAPPVRYPNVYGIDMPSAEELVAHGRNDLEVQQQLGCDWLIYQDLADLEAAVGGPKQRLTQFDSSCFTGEYVTGIQPGYFERIRQLRSDEAKHRRRQS